MPRARLGRFTKPMSKVFSYPKSEKLKNKKTIDLLFSEGKSVSKYPLKLIYAQTAPFFNTQIEAGVTVPKRNFKSAVTRNRIKRLLREAYRINKQEVFNNTEGRFAFLFLYLGKEVPTFKQVEKGMKVVLQRFFEAEITQNRKK